MDQKYINLTVNPKYIRTTVDYQMRNNAAQTDYYVYNTPKRQSPLRQSRRRGFRNNRSPRSRSPIRLESPYTPYSVPLEVSASEYIPQVSRDWPYTRFRLPYNSWRKVYDPVTGYQPGGEIYDTTTNPYAPLQPFNNYCILRINLEQAFLGDILEASRQQWYDFAGRNNFDAVVFHKDKNITDHVFMLFRGGYCPPYQVVDSLPPNYDIMWVDKNRF